MKVKDMNNKQHVQLTKVTDYDFVSAEKDKYGVFYSRDGLRLIDVDNKTFSCREYRIKESVKIICDYAFAGCSTIINVIIPDSVEVIGERAFSGCFFLREVSLGNSVKIIKEFAFKDCKALLELKLPESLEEIGLMAFSYTSLKEIVLPKSLLKITGNPIVYNKVKFVNNSPNFTVENENLFTKNKRVLISFQSNVTSYIIPKSVVAISGYAFWYCKSFKEIIIPKSVQYIDRLAFRYCRNLKAVYIPDSVKRIGMYAFSDCQEITTVRRGRSIYREYESMGLIATPPGNKEKIERMLPKYLHDIIKELTYKEFINCNMQLYENIKTEREYDYNYLDRVKCPRCGDWYYVDDGVCDTCGYPWNE